jgi:hypothetical protein
MCSKSCNEFHIFNYSDVFSVTQKRNALTTTKKPVKRGVGGEGGIAKKKKKKKSDTCSFIICVREIRDTIHEVSGQRREVVSREGQIFVKTVTARRNIGKVLCHLKVMKIFKSKLTLKMNHPLVFVANPFLDGVHTRFSFLKCI